jgi:hypothetical protein
MDGAGAFDRAAPDRTREPIHLRLGQSKAQHMQLPFSSLPRFLCFDRFDPVPTDSEVARLYPAAPALHKMPYIRLADVEFECHLLVRVFFEPLKCSLLIGGRDLHGISPSPPQGQARLLCPPADGRLRDAAQTGYLGQGVIAVSVEIKNPLVLFHLSMRRLSRS